MAHRDNEESERLQKVIARMGLASRREAEAWISAGRLSVNGRPAVLGQKVTNSDRLALDGRQLRQRAPRHAPVLLCHRSPGAPLLSSSEGAVTEGALVDGEVDNAGPLVDDSVSFAERLPRSAGRRFIAVSPLPRADGGLELLTAEGELALKLQRRIRSLEVEYSLRVRGELTPEQAQGLLDGQLDSGSRVKVVSLDPAGGEASNRWYRLVTLGASGSDVHRLVERQAATLVRLLRVRLGTVGLPRSLARGQWRELTAEELSSLDGAVAAPGNGHTDVPVVPARPVRKRASAAKTDRRARGGPRTRR